ncbi:AGC family protein kinase [Tritrichomonas foetus]|uniref:non-specific serine/threonine protein kinase n=1 Tax=Tritrichomonas foetus TaxID=1144522 RepID=A0A1J4KCV2_9EUKA|nr:AGC family protein kinase [Tritrichomonas foetus]|eukprot:OHT09043.1 AGC family protein kinase [Tritrichomonas foetus]
MQDYQLLDRIGSGSFGKVWKALRKSDNKIVALKKVDYSRMGYTEKQFLVNEVNILRKLQNEHVVRYLDRIVEKDKKIINIVMEYCPGGDLQSFIRKTRADRSYIDEDQIWLSLTELALALKDCHCGDEKILHRDIKPGNIFIDDAGHVKLGDFGLARSLTTDFAKTFVGTPYYMCPEITKNNCYNEECDIWALGCVIYEMAALEPPFKGYNQESLKRNILNSPVTRFSSRYSDALWKVVSWMLEKDPRRRPNVMQILKFRNVALTVKLNKVRKELSNVREASAELKEKFGKLQEKSRNMDMLEARLRRGAENLDNILI